MMLMRKFFTQLWALVACFMCSVNVHAQFTAEFEQEPVGYTVLNKSFPLSEIATTMGVEAAELTSTLQTWFAAEGETETNYFFLKTEDGLSSNYTQGGKGGFWMTVNPATPVGWTGEVGDDVWYNVLSIDEEEAALVIGVGQHPDAFVGGEEVNALFVLQFDGKEATFDVSLKITEKEKPNLPDPVTDLTQLNIVGSKDVAWDQYPNMPCNQIVDLTGVAAALGTTDDVIADNLSSFLFMQTLELKGEEESQKPYKTYTLSNASTAGGVGFWMAAVWDDENEAFSEELVRCVWGDHAAFRTMYSEQYSYDAAKYELASVTGWETYTQELGTKYNFNLYVVYGDKAYKIHHVITLANKPEEDPSKWSKIGEEEQTIEMWQGDYTETLTLDLDAIAAVLDGEVANLKVYGPSDDKGNIDDRHTANNGGMWFSGNGWVCQWSAADDSGSPYTFYIEPVNNGDFSSWNVGQNSGQTQAEMSYKTTLFFFNGAKSDTNNKYYAVNVTINITREPQPGGEFESVVEFYLTAHTEPSATDYPIAESPAVDLDALEAAIGTRSPVLYSWVKTDNGTDYSKSYTCTPYPGFWMDAEGYNVNWGPNAICGASYLSDGSFSLFQYPGRNQLGTVWKTTLFLVNAESGKMATIHLAIAFGETVSYEEVGKKDLKLIADPDTDHEVLVVDFADVVEAMGVEDVSELLNGQCVAAMTTDGTWSDPQIPSEGIAIDDKGYFNTKATAFSIYMSPGTDSKSVEFTVDNEEGITIDPDFKLHVKLAIQRDVAGVLKQYTLNITIESLAAFTSIDNLKSTADKAVIYDLSGRRSDATRKGVYIKDGKKMVK